MVYKLYFSLEQYISLISASLTFFGIVAAFILYYIQRRNNKKDAFNSFQDNLKDIEKTVCDTIDCLEEFCENLKSPNDKFGNPSIPASLNDKFLDRINISDLNRYYRKKANNSIYREFIVDCNFIGAYYNNFSQEISFFRNKFLEFENNFREHRSLFTNKYFETIANEETNNNFLLKYRKIRNELYKDEKTYKKKEEGVLVLINRDLLIKKYVGKLIEVSYEYIFDDDGGLSSGNENEINAIANTISATRLNMNTTKKAIRKLICEDIKKFKRILKRINKLVKSESIRINKKQFLKEFKSSIKEVILAKEGKIQLKTAEQLLDEL